jgi:zinc transporter ZupT
MEILWWKVISIFVMMLLVWFGGFLPTQLHALAEDKRQFALGLGNAFSGGVFLCVGLVHLLPEAAEQIEHLNYKFNETIPIAYVIAMGGFLLIFWIEKILLSSSDPEEHRAVFLHLPPSFFIFLDLGEQFSFYSSPKSDCSNSVQGRSQRHGRGRHRGTCVLLLLLLLRHNALLCASLRASRRPCSVCTRFHVRSSRTTTSVSEHAP